jgi:hypothetical protein
MTYLELETLVNDPDFQARCMWAARKAAEDIRNNPEVATLQRKWSEKIIYTGRTNCTLQMLACQVLRNPTIQANGAASPDSDIQFQINSIIDDLAKIG